MSMQYKKLPKPTPLNIAGLVIASFFFGMLAAYSFLYRSFFGVVVTLVGLVIYMSIFFLYYVGIKRKKIFFPSKKYEDSEIELGILREGYFQMEKLVKKHQETEKDLREKISELQKFTDVTVGREKRMIELKKELKDFKKREARKGSLYED